MINELAEYQIQSNECLWSDLKDDMMLENIIEFWSERKSLPAWREFAHLCYLLQPTSATSERAFSILKYIYTEQQSSLMVDLIKTTLMLRYNKKRFFFISNFNRSLEVMLMTDDRNSYNSNFLKHIWW